MTRSNVRILPNPLAYHVKKIELKRDVYMENQIKWVKVTQYKDCIKIMKNLMTIQQIKF